MSTGHEAAETSWIEKELAIQREEAMRRLMDAIVDHDFAAARAFSAEEARLTRLLRDIRNSG